MNDIITEQEFFEICLRNFLQWLELISMEPVELCNKWGNYNVAWELVTDLKADGSYIVDCPSGYLELNQKAEIINFLDRRY
jgi:hypothetical protein